MVSRRSLEHRVKTGEPAVMRLLMRRLEIRPVKRPQPAALEAAAGMAATRLRPTLRAEQRETAEMAEMRARRLSCREPRVLSTQFHMHPVAREARVVSVAPAPERVSRVQEGRGGTAAMRTRMPPLRFMRLRAILMPRSWRWAAMAAQRKVQGSVQATVETQRVLRDPIPRH